MQYLDGVESAEQGISLRSIRTNKYRWRRMPSLKNYYHEMCNIVTLVPEVASPDDIDTYIQKRLSPTYIPYSSISSRMPSFVFAARGSKNTLKGTGCALADSVKSSSSIGCSGSFLIVKAHWISAVFTNTDLDPGMKVRFMRNKRRWEERTRRPCIGLDRHGGRSRRCRLSAPP